MSSQADHGGHRERMRKRFKESGNFKGFSEHEILEMLLFYIVPRKNTNDIAHELIKKFGSLNSVLNASVEELSSVKDMGESSANSLLFFRELINYCSTVTDSRIDIRNISAALSFVNNCFRNEKQEKFKVICIDSGFHIKSVTDISAGGARFTPVDFNFAAFTCCDAIFSPSYLLLTTALACASALSMEVQASRKRAAISLKEAVPDARSALCSCINFTNIPPALPDQDAATASLAALITFIVWFWIWSAASSNSFACFFTAWESKLIAAITAFLQT